METFVIHPKDQAQQKALQTFLNGSNIPYENEPEIDETERILANSVMAKRLDESIKNIEQGNVTAVKLKDLWK
ncbi:MAG TPA: hypothetical protein VF623_13795 [Segetibacter sp.]|jgi:hypothetical protein